MPTVSGFLNTDAMNFVACPECHADAGSVCIVRGRKLKAQHQKRVDAYLKEFPDRLKLYEEGPDRFDRTLIYNERQRTYQKKR